MFRRHSTRRRRSPTTLGLQELEPRLALAGDVNVSFRGGTVTLQGDNQANNIWIYQDAGNTVIMPPPFEIGGATRIRFGGAILGAPLVIEGVHTINADMRGGDDVLMIDGDVADPLSLRAVSVNGGSGLNTLELRNLTVARNLTVHGGNGSDFIRVEEATVGSNVRVHAGSGENRVAIESVEAFGVLEVLTGAGGDAVQLLDIEGNAAITVNTGAGDDQLEARTPAPDFVRGRSLAVHLGAGNDDARIDRLTITGGVTVTSGAGNDELGIGTATIGGRLRVDAGDGTNAVLLVTAFAMEGMEINTGRGVDSVVLLNSSTFGALRIRTGGDQDAVRLATVTAGAIDLDVGAGDDVVELVDVTFASRRRFDGGSGRDTVSFQAAQFLPSYFTNFEVLVPVV